MIRRAPVRVKVAKLFRTVFPAAMVLVAGVVGILGFFTYRVTHPGVTLDTISPRHYLLTSSEVSIASADGFELAGWWIPGLKGAPGIVLAPGYGMTRSDALSLATLLHEDGFNLVIFGERGSSSTLGLNESDDVLAAVRYLKQNLDTDSTHLGIWGVDVGARAALKAAASVADVRTIAADGAFEYVSDFLDYRVNEDLGFDNKILQFGCRQMFRIANLMSDYSIDDKLPLEELSDRNILFIQGKNRERLGRLTAVLRDEIQPRKEMVLLESARVHMMAGEDLRKYDRQVAEFFHQHLPAAPEEVD